MYLHVSQELHFYYVKMFVAVDSLSNEHREMNASKRTMASCAV